MWPYILTVMIIIVAYYLNKLVLAPFRLKARYAQAFKRQGYRVLELPYQPIGAPYFEMLAKAEKEKGDTFYHHKNTLHQYDLIISNVLNHVQLVLLDEKLIKQSFTPDKLASLYKHQGPYGIFLMIIERGIIMTEDQEWKKKKKVLSKVFNYQFITSEIPNISIIADKVLDQFQEKFWESNPEKRNSGQYQVKLYDLMVKFTSEVVISSFLGIQALKEEVQGKTITELIVKLSDLGTLALKDPLLILFGKKFLNLRLRQKDREYQDLFKLVDSILKDFIERKEKDMLDSQKQKKTHKTIIELLMEERRGSLQTNEITYSDPKDLIAEVKTFLIAGSETTSNFLSAMFMYVFEKPDVVRKLREQIDSIIKSDKDLTVQNFKKMTYLDCIINEVSRIFMTAVGMFEREAVQQLTIGGVQLQKGVCMFPQWISPMYNPETFKDPHDFKPERWQEEQAKKNQGLISIIFSGGPRSCIGKHLALTEIKVMAIKFMQRYNKLIQSKVGKRQFELLLTYHVKTDLVTLFKHQK